MSIKKLGKQKSKIDRNFLFVVLGLTFFGLIALADASAPIALRDFSDKFYFVKQQILWVVAGLVGLAIAANVDYKIWKKFAVPIFFLSLLGLVFVLVPGVGVSLLGAKRWIVLGPVSFQPSEFVKLAMVLYIAKVAEKEKGYLAYILPVGVVCLLVMLQPDLGTTIVIAATALFQLFVSGVSILKLAGTIIAGIAATIVLILTSEYRRARLLTFFENTQDPLGQSYHIRQVLLALGSGGVFGVGLGQSRQKFLFLPETATDSIFAVIAEETGFIGAGILVLVFLFFVFKGLKIARGAPDRFAQVLAYGIICWIGMQVVLNIGSMVALTPLTGIPLPFFSAGGSSLISILVGCGILLNISRHAKPEK